MHRTYHALLALLLAALVLAGWAMPALAENLGPGGGTRVITGDQVVGPYRLWITSSPEPAQVGTVTIDARVNDAKTGAKIGDADIQVELTNPVDGSVIKHAVTHLDSGNALDYAAHIDLPAAGSWNGVIRIQSAQGSAEVNFVQRVLEPRSSSTLVVIGLPFLIILSILGGVWYRRASAARSARLA